MERLVSSAGNAQTDTAEQGHFTGPELMPGKGSGRNRRVPTCPQASLVSTPQTRECKQPSAWSTGVCQLIVRRQGERCGEAAASDPVEGLPAGTGRGRTPERRSTASFRILRREEEVEDLVEGNPLGLVVEWPAIRALPATSGGKVVVSAGAVCGSRSERDGAAGPAGASGGWARVSS
ncbi:hypothetical protein D5F01_LYC19161 [Larimichthys crocea]|uniref:Uncharacterized protein n=1 Tax=Larimichthys crocea TaxID=215358 RepID=A0A6G0HR91_LARCR|nr:hypothetical protein D5F01_LYC19161 [Larimichthys crocea]